MAPLFEDRVDVSTAGLFEADKIEELPYRRCFEVDHQAWDLGATRNATIAQAAMPALLNAATETRSAPRL